MRRARGPRLPRSRGEDGVLGHARLSPRREAAGLNRARALAALNDRLLREFSRRTTERLRAALRLRIALPSLEPFLEENVAKEARKDALVIACADEALAAGEPPGPQAARRLLASARQIDREFLARVGRLPVRISIPYERVEPLRLRRIELGLELAWRILQAWRQGEKARRAIPRQELSRRLLEIFELYAEETRALSHALGLPAPLAALRERFAQALTRVMREAARDAIASHKAR